MRTPLCAHLSAGFAISIASIASAATPGLDLQFSFDGSAWQNSLVTLPGSSVLVRVVMTIPTTYYGIGNTRFNIQSSNIPGWDADGDDTIDLSVAKGNANDGRMPGFDFINMTQQVFESANSLRIDAKGDTANNPGVGISCVQNTEANLGTAFNTAKSAAIFMFKVNLTPAWLSRIELRFFIADGVVENGAANQINTFRAYSGPNDPIADDVTGPISGDVGSIYILPAPSALAAGLLASLITTRRRR
ncbi:MAG TPA: hypothetical protein VK176_12965 [Phycisphaerales bacterium]|nr:hypothetical protein [Phycisphaerales bacterium]